MLLRVQGGRRSHCNIPKRRELSRNSTMKITAAQHYSLCSLSRSFRLFDLFYSAVLHLPLQAMRLPPLHRIAFENLLTRLLHLPIILPFDEVCLNATQTVSGSCTLPSSKVPASCLALVRLRC